MTDYNSDTEDSIDHTDPETLRRLYWDEGLSQAEMADVLELSRGGVKYWMNKLDVNTKTAAQAAAESCRANKANYTLNNQGYQVWRSREDGKDIAVGVHRLLAIAEGADPYDIFSDGTHVHHANGIKWLNTPDNIEPMSRKEHISSHTRGEGCGTGKLSRQEVIEIKELLTDGTPQSEIADRYNVTPSNISRINTGSRWSHLE